VRSASRIRRCAGIGALRGTTGGFGGGR